MAQTGFDDAALDDGQFLVWNFDAEIAARHHDTVGLLDDFLEVLHGLLVFNFGDDKWARFAFLKKLLQLKQIAGFANEGKRDKIHADFEAEHHVPDVLGREGRQADLDAGQINVAPAAEFSLCENFALD